jgi:hypothetical protein
MKPETTTLLELCNQPYTMYNDVLPAIKSKLGDKAGVFEQILSEELPLTTARRAYRTAVKIASGELDVYREFPPDSMGRKKFVKKVTK